ncbi:hypothetical protein FQR65_LT06063 [Abscondita terminalis]|nr:hypothetical protein FQR65_LT06063 [Abscondita terminalis]
MYKPPENSNRVKIIKSKFENNANDVKPIAKPLLRKSKTLQDFSVTSSSIRQEKLQANQKNKIENKNNPQTLSRQLSDPTKRNIKRTPAFRLDKSSDTNAGFVQNKTRYLEKFSKNTHLQEDIKEGAIIDNNNFSNILNKFNANTSVPVINDNGKDTSNVKLLYSEPVPKSQRTNEKKALDEDVLNVYNATTLKISESHSKNIKTNVHAKKEIIDITLTDTLKNALKKPLPKGPAPKKPPRTFLHSTNNNIKLTHLTPDFTKKLNLELQKNVPSVTKKTKSDPKYMLDKLENVLRNKGVLRKNLKTDLSEDESDNDKFIVRDLPTIPAFQSTSSPEVSPKFNLSCLPSLSCSNSEYAAVKEPNSSFFVDCKEEPVYAEPFEYQLDVEQRNCHGNNGAIENVAGESASGRATIRRSVHYASSPVPDVKIDEGSNHVSDVKVQDQMFYQSLPSSTTTSDMESVVSTPSEENNLSVSVKDLIKAIETSSIKSRKPKSPPINIKPNANGHLYGVAMSYDRVKKLEDQLKTTLEKSFAVSEGNISKLGEEEDEKHTSKFQTYVKKIRSKACLIKPKKDNLFSCCLLLALNGKTPYVKSKYPLDVQEPYRIADLCFPEVESGPMDTSVEAQCYSLIITDEHGDRTFGYCRRVLPEASTTCLPLAYCILSKHKAPGFYRRVLEELERRHGYPDKFIDAFIKELYLCKFPKPGDTMVLDCSKIVNSAGCEKFNCRVLPSDVNDASTNQIEISINVCDRSVAIDGNSYNSEEEKELDLNTYVIVCNRGEYGTLVRNSHNPSSAKNGRGTSAIIDVAREVTPLELKRSTSSPNLLANIESMPSELVLMRPHDSRHEENDLMLLGETLKLSHLEKIFASLLLERKVILVSSVLRRTSVNIISVFLATHDYTSTPRSLWEIVDTPTPLLCGVLSAEVVKDYVIENGIVVNLDEDTILHEVGDENKILPHCLTQTLKDGVQLATSIAASNSGAHNIFFSDAFLRIFIYTCGHYKNFINDGNFNKSEFAQTGMPKRKIREFLKWFTETTMFHHFIDLATSKSNNLDLFDQRILIYNSDSAVDILNKMKSRHTYRGLLSPHLIRFQ